MVIISDINEECEDLDWYAVDKSGCIAHFATGGRGFLPHSVKTSSENRIHLHSFFTELPEFCKNTHLASAKDDNIFGEMARRGLFSYDCLPRNLRPVGYFRLYTPTLPLKLQECPEIIQTIIKQTTATKLFSETEEFSLQMIL